MDIEATLSALRRLATETLDVADCGDCGASLSNTQIELAETFQALDEWLMRGGYPPSDWIRSA